MFLLGRRAHKHKGSSSHVRRIASDVHEQCFDEFEEGPFIGETAGDVGANHAWADDVDYGGGAGYVSRTDVTRYSQIGVGVGKKFILSVVIDSQLCKLESTVMEEQFGDCVVVQA